MNSESISIDTGAKESSITFKNVSSMKKVKNILISAHAATHHNITLS
ncbi:TPA: hypothetical protein EYG96_02480 [Candidatus Gracilibacteria bacterium]|nr:hypothetical protein [Candidatus Gracilibacteria bacterium]HIQ57556.1 hypothetical protein [Candidatus Gracilibacteria bacterium]